MTLSQSLDEIEKRCVTVLVNGAFPLERTEQSLKDIPKLIQAVRVLSEAIEKSKEELPEAYEFYFEEALQKAESVLRS